MIIIFQERFSEIKKLIFENITNLKKLKNAIFFYCNSNNLDFLIKLLNLMITKCMKI